MLASVLNSSGAHGFLRATEQDVPCIHRLAHRIWPVCYGSILSKAQIDNMLESIYSETSLVHQMREGQEFWLWYVEGKEVGYASIIPQFPDITLKKLYLLPELQGRGMGQAMLEQLLRHYPQSRLIKLYVNADNLPAQRFYERAGFYRAGSEVVRMGDYEFIDLVYRKDL